MSRDRARFHRLTVAQVEPLTPDSAAITFTVPPELAAAYDFTAGQHLTIRHVANGEAVRRTYSICAPAGAGLLRVAVRRLPGGAFSSFATESLRPGDTLEVMTPAGRFSLRPDSSRARQVAAIAAGSGITPVLSILGTLLEREPASRATLVYVNRDSRSAMFVEELADLKDRYLSRFMLLHVLTREPGEIEARHGRLDAAKLGGLLDTLIPAAEVADWYLCGPAGLVEMATTTLRSRGVPRQRVRSELFHLDGEPPRPADATPAAEADGTPGANDSAVTVVLDGRASSFRLARTGPSVLAATLAVRPDAPYACASGVCGTCRAKVTSGSVAMDRNHALDPDEVADGYALACQSHPASAEVTLDFDR